MTDPPGRLTGGNHGPNAGASPCVSYARSTQPKPCPSVCRAKGGITGNLAAAPPPGAPRPPPPGLRRHDLGGDRHGHHRVHQQRSRERSDPSRSGCARSGCARSGCAAKEVADGPSKGLFGFHVVQSHPRATKSGIDSLYTLPLHAASTRCLYTLPLHAAPAVHWPCIGPSLHTTRARTHVNSTRTLPAIKSHRAALTFRMRFIREFALLS